MISFSCIIKICNNTSVLNTLKSFVPYAAIAFVPNFVYMALPLGHPIKNKVSANLIFTKSRRDVK